MPLTLTITDAQDGTGGSAVISGSAGGSANQIYYTAFDGITPSRTWTAGGACTGDGTISLPIGTGYFEFQLVTNGALGPINYRNFTDLATIDALHYQYLQGSKVRASQLSFPVLDALGSVTLDSTRMNVAWLPRATEIDLTALPLLWISPPGFEVDVSTVNSEDDFQYPVILAIMTNQKADSRANLQAVLKWREQLLRAFSKYQVPSIDGARRMWAVPKPMQIADPASYTNANILLSALGFGFQTRMTRGLT